MVFKATFNNMSVISWRSVLLVEETGIPEENHRPVASHWHSGMLTSIYTRYCDYVRSATSFRELGIEVNCHCIKYVVRLWNYFIIQQYVMWDELPEENHRPVASHWQALSHNVVSNIPCHERDSNSQLSYDHDHDGPLKRYVTLLCILYDLLHYMFQ
jgi:hypothetical protein